jgi:hypothetical protein
MEAHRDLANPNTSTDSFWTSIAKRGILPHLASYEPPSLKKPVDADPRTAGPLAELKGGGLARLLADIGVLDPVEDPAVLWSTLETMEERAGPGPCPGLGPRASPGDLWDGAPFAAFVVRESEAWARRVLAQTQTQTQALDVGGSAGLEMDAMDVTKKRAGSVTDAHDVTKKNADSVTPGATKNNAGSENGSESSSEIAEAAGAALKPTLTSASLLNSQHSHTASLIRSRVLFPQEILSDSIYSRDPVESMRRDFGDIPVYVIDSPTAHELDDGISIEETPDGVWVHAHIADPSHLIPPNHPLSILSQVSRPPFIIIIIFFFEYLFL